jgi:hypothetical protein
MAKVAGGQRIAELDGLGVRALRLNLQRGVHSDWREMARLARLAHEVATRHAEPYLDSRDLRELTRLDGRSAGVLHRLSGPVRDTRHIP